MDSGTTLRQLPSPPSGGILAGRARKVLEPLVLGLKSGPHGNEYMVLLSIKILRESQEPEQALLQVGLGQEFFRDGPGPPALSCLAISAQQATVELLLG